MPEEAAPLSCGAPAPHASRAPAAASLLCAARARGDLPLPALGGVCGEVGLSGRQLEGRSGMLVDGRPARIRSARCTCENAPRTTS